MKKLDKRNSFLRTPHTFPPYTIWWVDPIKIRRFWAQKVCQYFPLRTLQESAVSLFYHLLYTIYPRTTLFQLTLVIIPHPIVDERCAKLERPRWGKHPRRAVRILLSWEIFPGHNGILLQEVRILVVLQTTVMNFDTKLRCVILLFGGRHEQNWCRKRNKTDAVRGTIFGLRYQNITLFCKAPMPPLRWSGPT